MMRKFEEQAAAAADLKEKMGSIKGEASSQDGSVTVTVAPSGAVLNLQLSANAMRQSHTALQAAIMGAIRQATQKAAEQMDETVQPILGDKAEQFKQAFNAHGVQPTPPGGADSPGSTVPTPSRQSPSERRPDDDDDDFTDGSFLR